MSSGARSALAAEILRYYEAGREADRLEAPFFRWERIRTLDLLDRFLRPPPGVVLDVGGGAGAYAFPLAEKGYTVDLVDPVPLHIDQARKHAAGREKTPRNFMLGDARAIPCPDGAAQAVLFFGPLYHLTDAHDRVTAIREAHRALGAGGVLMAVAISRFASALDGIGRGLIRDARFIEIVEGDLATGQHRNDTENFDYFTTAFFHHPDELKEELVEGGFRDAKLCAIEGPLWTVPECSNAEEQTRLMAIMQAIESEPTLIGASAHIMGIGIKA